MAARGLFRRRGVVVVKECEIRLPNKRDFLLLHCCGPIETETGFDLRAAHVWLRT